MLIRMKNSGIEWVGEIPAHWEVMSNKHLMQKQKIICPIYKGQAILSLTMKGVIERDLDAGGKMPSSFDGYQYVKRGNLLLCLFDIDVTPRCAGLILKDGVTSPAYSQYIMRQKAYAPYYSYYYVMVDNTKELLHMAKNLRHSLNEEQFGAIKAPVPPISEQKAIAEFLDKKCGEVDALIADIQQEIETLEQYKRSVITEAVTKGLDPSVPMKDSGIDYLGRINSEWRLSKLGYICQKLNRPVPEKAEALICSNKGKIVLREDVSVGLISENDRMYQGVKVGDLCIHGMDTWHGAIAVSSLNGKITTVVHCCDSREDKRFIAYYLQMLAFKKVYKAISNGVRGNTSDFRSWDKAGDIYIVLPNRETQQQIADYLDKKCKEIEGVIADKQSQIETLESYKKSLIYEYVTGKKEIIAQ